MIKELGNLPKGLLFILSAPTATGKTTLANMLVKENSSIIRSISCTTRKPRAGEINGRDYYFISEKEFLQKRKNNEFLEWAEVFGNYYGTLKKTVDENLAKGLHVLLVIDVQGAFQVKEKEEVTMVFLLPPSLETLKNRFADRNTEEKKEFEKRLKSLKNEIKASEKYDYIVINEELSIAYNVIKAIFIAEEHRTKNMRR